MESATTSSFAFLAPRGAAVPAPGDDGRAHARGGSEPDAVIGFIRQRALGSPLVAYDVRVDRAVAKVLAGGTWTAPQQRWLARIAEQLKREVVVDADAFTKGAFVNVGGWKGVDRALDGRLQQVMDDLGAEIWNDAA